MHMTNSSGQTYRATELSKFLIEVLANDASRAKRNILTSHKLVEFVRDVCNGIDGLIADVDNDDDGDDDDYGWTKFNEYTQAITPLEQFLFTLANVMERESEKFLPPDVAVNDLIASVQEWQDNRSELRGTLSLLKSEAPIKKVCPDLDAANLNIEEQQDDLKLLSELCIAIDKHTLWENPVARGTPIQDIRTSANVIRSQAKPSTPEHLVEQSIRCAMLVFGAMNLAATSNNNLKKSGRRLLGSKCLWTQGAKALDTVEKHLIDPDATAISTLENEWGELKRLLLAIEVELPPEYIALRQALKTARYPYYHRSVFLAVKCGELAAYFTSTPENKTSENMLALKNVVSKVTAAIEKADEYTDNYRRCSDNGSVDAAFDDASDQLKSFFGALQLDGDQLETDLEKASKIDQGLVTSMNHPKFKECIPNSEQPSSIRDDDDTSDGTKRDEDDNNKDEEDEDEDDGDDEDEEGDDDDKEGEEDEGEEAEEDVGDAEGDDNDKEGEEDKEEEEAGQDEDVD